MINYIRLLFSLIFLVGCTTTSSTYLKGSDEEILAEKTVVEYIQEKKESSKDFENDPCSDEMAWWCVGRLFTNSYDIQYIESAYGYIFYNVKFNNGNHLLISTEHVEGKWKVTQKPIRAGEEAYYLGTHSQGKKFKVLYIKFNKAGTVDFRATIEK